MEGEATMSPADVMAMMNGGNGNWNNNPLTIKVDVKFC